METFEKIFEDNRELVFRFLLKLCRSGSLAEELTQETFFRAYINFSSLRNKERCSTWLCQTAKNCYYRWYNEQKKLVTLDDAPEEASDPFVQTDEIGLSQAAAEALDRLEEPYREVFSLAVFGGVPLKEISLKFGRSESWARVTFYRARQKLTERIKNNEL